MISILGVAMCQLRDLLVCVPRTSSVLISRRNRLTSAHHDRAAKFHAGRLGLAI
jgi:hypothetical protein